MKQLFTLIFTMLSLTTFAQDSVPEWRLGGSLGFSQSLNRNFNNNAATDDISQYQLVFSPYLGKKIATRWYAGVLINSSYHKSTHDESANEKLKNNGWSLGSGLFARYDLSSGSDRLNFFIEPVTAIYFDRSRTMNLGTLLHEQNSTYFSLQ